MTAEVPETATSDTTAATAEAGTRRGRIRRRQLIDATITLAGRNGVTATSIKDIAHAVAVAPGLVHYHFESKDDLLVEVIGRLEEDLMGVWRRGVTGHADPLDRLAGGLTALATDADQRLDRRRLLADLNTQSLTSPLVRERLAGLAGALRDEIEHELRHVLGRLPAYALAPPHDIARAVTAAIDGIVMEALVCGDSPAPALHALLVMVLSAVATAHVIAGEAPPLERLRVLARPPAVGG